MCTTYCTYREQQLVKAREEADELRRGRDEDVGRLSELVAAAERQRDAAQVQFSCTETQHWGAWCLSHTLG